jgi:hypothetical protein
LADAVRDVRSDGKREVASTEPHVITLESSRPPAKLFLRSPVLAVPIADDTISAHERTVVT